ncbi:MAG: PilZ domain-containing protein [Terriglobales bacterium]
MTLSSLVVSRDWAEVSVLQCILGSLHIGVEVETEPERALDKIAKSKIDALIVDSDLAGTPGLLRGLGDSFFQNTVPLVVLRGPSGTRDFESKDATFIFQKPISVEQAVHTLSAARNMILNGRLRYHRQPLDSPVSVTFNRNSHFQAHILNVSQGGVRVHTQEALPGTGPVKINFALPGTKRSLKLAGEVVWQNGQGEAGIRFLDANLATKRNLQLWLERQYLSN